MREPRLEDGTRVNFITSEEMFNAERADRRRAGQCITGAIPSEFGTVVVNNKIAGVAKVQGPLEADIELAADSIPLYALMAVPNFKVGFTSGGNTPDRDADGNFEVKVELTYGDGTEAVYRLKAGNGIGSYLYEAGGKTILVDALRESDDSGNLGQLMISKATLIDLFGWDVETKGDLIVITSDTKDIPVNILEKYEEVEVVAPDGTIETETADTVEDVDRGV